MSKKSVQKLFSAAILVMALLLAGVVVFAAEGNNIICSYSGSYASIVKEWPEDVNEATLPGSITITLEHRASADENSPWEKKDVTLTKGNNWSLELGKEDASFKGYWKVPVEGIRESGAPGYEIDDFRIDGKTLTITNKPIYYKVTYTDGVDGEEVFDDQVKDSLTYGTKTPGFEGELVRKGYTFKGWTPAVAETVTKNAIYTALWEKAEEPTIPTIPTVPTTPVTPIYYTVTYTDGVDGEEIFADQVTDRLTYGTKTPEFEGEPVREGYTFEGWTPAVADQVTGNAVYVAMWKPIGNLEEPDIPAIPDIDPVPPEETEKPELPTVTADKASEKVDHNPAQPKTGDEMQLMTFTGLLMAAIGGLGAVCLMRRKHLK